MTNIKSISIPKPCHQSWQQMTEVSNGRHCASCSKTVADFTSMSNDEIISYFVGHRSVCGRIGQYQLAHINNTLSAQKLKAGWWKRAVIVLGLIGPALFKANAQSKHIIVKTHNNRKARAENKDLLEVRSLNYVPQPVFISNDQVKPYRILPQTTMTAVLGGLVAVPYDSNFFEFKKVWHRFKGRFGETRSELVNDSVDTCSPCF